MSLKPYPKYKDSGVEWLGEVPEHWDMKRLKYIAILNPSKSEIAHLADTEELSFLPMEAIGEKGELDLSRTRPISEVSTGYSYFADGDVVFAKVTPCFENGKGALVSGLLGGRGFGTTEVTVLRPKDSRDASYLWWLTSSQFFRSPAVAEMVGAGGLKRVPEQFVSDFRIAIPPYSERVALSLFLDQETAKTDALIAEQEKLIALLAEKRQATISHAVTKGLNPTAKMKDSGVEWFDTIPAHWTMLTFQRCVSVAEGQVDPEVAPYRSMILIAPNHIESGTGRLLELETAEQQSAESGKYYCRSGDVIYSKIRPNLRKVCLAPEDCLCSADMYPLSGNQNLNNTYLLWFLLSEPFSAWAVLESDRVAMPKINRESLKDVWLALPPSQEQQEIVEFLNRETARLDALSAEACRVIDLLKERRTALISAAVTGKIDVRGVVEPEKAAA